MLFCAQRGCKVPAGHKAPLCPVCNNPLQKRAGRRGQADADDKFVERRVATADRRVNNDHDGVPLTGDRRVNIVDRRVGEEQSK